MKTLFSFIAILAATVSFSQTTSETRTVGDFTGVHVSSSITVELSQGDSNSVVVEGDASDVKKVVTEVHDGILSVSSNGLGSGGDDLKVKVVVKNLHSIEASGAAEITSSNQITSDTLAVITNGSASIKADVKTNSVKTVLTGASEIKLSGNTSQLDAVLSGASELKAYSLTSEKANVVTSGASTAHVTASNSIVAVASGASDIRFQGNPAEKNINASSSASVIAKDSNGNSTDTTSIHVGNYNVNVTEADDDERSKREKKANNDKFEFWSGIDFGVAGYTTFDNQVNLPPSMKFLEVNYAKSYVFGLNAFQKNIHIYRNNVNLATGLGLTWYHYNFRNSYSLTPNVPYATATLDTLNYKRNRLNMCYANIPLFLEFNTNNNDASKSFHIGAGVDFGYNVFNNRLKQKYTLDGHDYKRKEKDDFNVNPFRYDLIARIGYGKFTIFGSYALSTLFEKDKGPSVYPVSAGVHFDF